LQLEAAQGAANLSSLTLALGDANPIVVTAGNVDRQQDGRGRADDPRRLDADLAIRRCSRTRS
jgi:hypothetical protein